MGGCASVPDEGADYNEADFERDKVMLIDGLENYTRKLPMFGYGPMGIDAESLGVEEDPEMHDHEEFTADWNQLFMRLRRREAALTRILSLDVGPGLMAEAKSTLIEMLHPNYSVSTRLMALCGLKVRTMPAPPPGRTARRRCAYCYRRCFNSVSTSASTGAVNGRPNAIGWCRWRTGGAPRTGSSSRRS